MRKIRRAATIPPLQEYLRRRHNWSRTDQNKVDWALLERAARTSTIPSPQLLKLVHNKMPTRYELSKSNLSVTRHCPHCHAIENFTHILRCDNPIAEHFRVDLMEQVENFFTEQETPAAFRQLFISSFMHWLEPLQTQTALAELTHESHRQQSQIGWDLLPRGFLATAWTEDLHRSYTISRVIPPHDSATFMTSLIHIIWKAQLQFWKQITENYHNSTQPQTSYISQKRHDLQLRIRQLHQTRSQCLAQHQHDYFLDNLDEYVQQATIPQMKSYLHHYEPVIHQSIRDAQKLTTRNIFQFPGFTLLRRRRNMIPPSLRARPRMPTSTLHPANTSTSTGAPIPHKHTRWRQAMPSILDFFRSKPPP